MKKRIVFALIVLAIVAGMAAAQEIIVDKITGKVEYQLADGSWQAVKLGQKLLLTDVVNTKLSSQLVLKIGDEVVTIKAMQKGTLAKLLEGKLSAKTANGLKMAAQVKGSDVAVTDKGGNTNISTASTRASEATEDTEWVE